MQNFVQGDRNQPYLLPPDLREWLPEDDLAHFVVVAAVAAGAVESFSGKHSGHGVSAIPPAHDAGVIDLLLCERAIFLAPD